MGAACELLRRQLSSGLLQAGTDRSNSSNFHMQQTATKLELGIDQRDFRRLDRFADLCRGRWTPRAGLSLYIALRQAGFRAQDFGTIHLV